MPDVDPQHVLLTFTDVQARLACSRAALYQLIRDGRFPRPRRVGRQWRWTEEDWRAYLLLSDRWHPGPFGPDKEKRKKSPGAGSA